MSGAHLLPQTNLDSRGSPLRGYVLFGNLGFPQTQRVTLLWPMRRGWRGRVVEGCGLSTACEAQAGPGAEGGSRRTGESDTRSLSQRPHLRARPTSRSGNADALTLQPPVATSPRLRCAKRLTQHVFGKGTVMVGKAKPSSFLSHAGREGRRPRLTGTSGPSGLSLLIVPEPWDFRWSWFKKENRTEQRRVLPHRTGGRGRRASVPRAEIPAKGALPACGYFCTNGISNCDPRLADRRRR